MKIRVLQRCESSDEIMFSAESREEAEEKAADMALAPHVLGVRVIAFAAGKAFASHVARFHKGEYDVPLEVADELLERELAVLAE